VRGRRCEVGGAHQAVWDVGIDAIGAGAEQQGGAEHMAGNDSSPAIFSPDAVAVADIELFAFAPKAEKILGIALAIGVDLEDERNAPTRQLCPCPCFFVLESRSAVEDDFADLRLLAENWHDDHELGSHDGGGGRRGRGDWLRVAGEK